MAKTQVITNTNFFKNFSEGSRSRPQSNSLLGASASGAAKGNLCSYHRRAGEVAVENPRVNNLSARRACGCNVSECNSKVVRAESERDNDVKAEPRCETRRDCAIGAKKNHVSAEEHGLDIAERATL